MIVHEPIDNVRSTNQLLYYSSPKTSEDAHEFMLVLQKFLLDELENSEENSGHTLYGEVYDNDLYLSMKAIWDLFTGEITHENQEPINYLLLKFPDVHHEHDQYCTVEFLIQYHHKKNKLTTIGAVFVIKILQQRKSLPLLSIPPSCAFYSVAVEETIMAPFLQQFRFLPLASI